MNSKYIDQIQAALRDEGLDGWLFFDHHQHDPLAYRILKLKMTAVATRRWYYFIPAQGEPRGLVHNIEPMVLDGLPGKISKYSSWITQSDGIKELLGDAHNIAMQYSPNCAIPYVSLVDGGTIELIRHAGAEIHTSANLVQLFEARWTADQLEMHLEAGRRVDSIRADAFRSIASAIADKRTITEWDVNRFIRAGFEASGLVTDHGPIVAVNANMSNPHYEPEANSSREIHSGDAVLIDMWAKLSQPSAVFYDITWTGYCGADPPSALENIFDIVRTARDRAVDRVQNAISRGQTICGFEIDDAARAYIQDQGFGEVFIHRTGHSIGEEVHGTGANMDNLETHDERRIIPRTCFSVEPGIYLPEFGIRSEVNVYVGENEARVTGEIQRKLVTIL